MGLSRSGGEGVALLKCWAGAAWRSAAGGMDRGPYEGEAGGMVPPYKEKEGIVPREMHNRVARDDRQRCQWRRESGDRVPRRMEAWI